jgi:hypothetical protein
MYKIINHFIILYSFFVLEFINSIYNIMQNKILFGLNNADLTID